MQTITDSCYDYLVQCGAQRITFALALKHIEEDLLDPALTTEDMIRSIKWSLSFAKRDLDAYKADMDKKYFGDGNDK